MSDLPSSVAIQEVGPRDGLQIEPKILTADQKLALIRSMLDAGLAEIEVGSFVNPKAVPQMADSEEVVRRLPDPGDKVTYRALWLNLKGLERAATLPQLTIDGKLSITASETFIKRNTNRTIDEAIAVMPEWIAKYREEGIEPDTLSVMAAFGCNFEGVVPPAKVVGLVERVAAVMAEHGCTLRKLRLADTMGWAAPAQIEALVGRVRERWPEVSVALHLHDTRGMAIANALAGMRLGVRDFDSSVGGLGGCPFAGNKGAAGNVATEDLVFLCEEMGVATGVDLDALVETAGLAEELVGHPLPGKVMKSGSLNRFRQRAA
jgi:hydroxymethylglutaryl-CoA lyase